MMVESSWWSPGVRAGVTGFVLGAASLLGVWAATFAARGLSPSLDALVAIHHANPALWLLALLPSALGLGGVARASRTRAVAADPQDALARQLVAHLLDGVIVVDARGKVLALNPTARALFGYEAQEAVGLGIEALLPDHAVQDDDRSVIRTTSRELPLGVEWHVEGRHKDGEGFPLELTWFEGQGAAAGRFVYLVRDPLGVAAQLHRDNHALRDAIRRALAEVRNKDRFVARVAYDMRTPLSSLIGYVDILLEDAEDLGATRAVPDLERVRAAAHHLLAVLSNTLELIASEAELDTPVLADVDVRPLLDDLGRAMKRRARRNGNRLVVEVRDGVHHALADPFLMRRILFKLIDNACRHTEGGEIKVEAVVSQTASGERLRVYVGDTGRGLGPERAATIFDERDRSAHADDESLRRLTLPLARRLARRMGGELSVRSVSGEGSVFLLELAAGTTAPAAR